MKRILLIVLCLLLCSGAPIFNAFAVSGSDIEDMIPAFDSIMRVMLPEGAQYDPLAPEFFWEAIYLMAVNWSGDVEFEENGYDTYDQKIDYESCELLLSAMAVREMAIALFADYDGLLPIPDSISYLAEYDDESGVYRFPLSDAGDSYAKIDRYELSLQNFVFVVYTSLVSCSDDETLLSVKFELMPNTDSGDVILRYFPYSIVSAEIVK